MIIAIRRSRGASPLPIAAISSLASSVVAAPLSHPAGPDLLQLAELALFGTSQLGVALIGGLDVPLAPVWVWIAFAERPSPATIAGGLTVIVAVILNTLVRSSRRPAQPPNPVEDVV